MQSADDVYIIMKSVLLSPIKSKKYFYDEAVANLKTIKS